MDPERGGEVPEVEGPLALDLLEIVVSRIAGSVEEWRASAERAGGVAEGKMDVDAGPFIRIALGEAAK